MEVENILFRDIFKDKCFISFVFVLTFLFLSLSSVSSATYDLNSSITTDDFQSVIDNDTDDELVINLDDGDYSLGQINVTRNATIQGKGRNAKISGTETGILFNITASNVKIINLTITGFDTAIQSDSSYLTISGNNITTNGISIDIRSVGNDLKRISIENNVIVSSITNYNHGAIYISALDNSHIIISVSLIGNNIRGNSSSDSNGVRIRAVGCSSNITFTNNNITGTYGGIYLYAGSSNNTNISFTNNNITGKSRYGVYFGAESSNNSCFTFFNNKIIGTYGGVSLGAEINTNTNIFFINNNIIGTPSGVHLFSYSSKNINISFNNNNITGTSGKGVQLSSYSSNNTNISFNYNNITGISYGVDLSAYKNSKSQITFAKNNITGGVYGVYVYSFEGNIIGVSFLNNTITSSGDGFYFEYFESPDRIIPIASINISNFTISSNTIYATNGTGLNFTGLYFKCHVNVIVQYNRIIALVGVNITGFNHNSSFDYNWWGVNDITGKILGIITNNHYILNITNTSSLDSFQPGNNVSFAFLVLNTTLTNEGVGNLPYFALNGTFNGDGYNTSRDDLFEDNFTVSSGNQTLDASLDDQYVTFNFTVKFKNSTNSTILVFDVNIGENVTISGHMTGYFGNGSDFLTVTIDGNDYKVNIGSTGAWNLTYVTNRTGNILVVVSYSGNENYTGFNNSTNFNVAKFNTNSTISIIPSNVFVGDNVVISGYLANYTGIDSVNVTIGGVSKLVYVDNETGFWSLDYTANHTGTIDFVVSLFENPYYEDFTNIRSFTVNKVNVVSTLTVSGKFTYGETITLKSKLTKATNNGLPLKNKLVKFYVNNKLVGSKKTDSNGIVSFNYKIASRKKLTFKTVFAGDSEYNSKTSNIITKTPSKAIVSMVLSSKLYKKRIKVTLKFKRKALKSKWIKFYVKGKYVGKAKTNTKGITLFKYTKKHGKLTVKSVFLGDNLFKSIKNKRKIKL